VGFQLSYLAVIGIVSLHPPIYGLWSPKRNLTDKIWSLIAVSIAAQAATFPLATHYFSQFPNYFIATNLIVIPLSTCILYCGMLSCILIPVPYLNTAVTWLLSFLVKMMNASVAFIEGMPGAVSRDIFLSGHSAFILYLILALAYLWIIQPRKRMVWILFPLILFLLLLGITRKSQLADQQLICVYDTGRHPSMDFIDGREAVFLADSILLADESKQGFHLSGNRIQHAVKRVEGLDVYTDSIYTASLIKKQHLLEFKGFRMVLIDSLSVTFRSDSILEADAMFITGNPYLRMSELVDQYRPSLVLISSDNSIYQTKRWIPELDSLGIDYWDIREKGAWVRRL
jgi:competence protein ComEC